MSEALDRSHVTLEFDEVTHEPLEKRRHRYGVEQDDASELRWDRREDEQQSGERDEENDDHVEAQSNPSR